MRHWFKFQWTHINHRKIPSINGNIILQESWLNVEICRNSHSVFGKIKSLNKYIMPTVSLPVFRWSQVAEGTWLNHKDKKPTKCSVLCLQYRCVQIKSYSYNSLAKTLFSYLDTYQHVVNLKFNLKSFCEIHKEKIKQKSNKYGTYLETVETVVSEHCLKMNAQQLF